ncbi:MAG: phage holin family protein [Spirulina sp. SIO3F2]|nr:phage holin family protein [Spirulina sp. SIO3F2]
MLEFILIAVITTVSLLIISKLPILGVEIESLNKAIISGLVLGVLNAGVYAVLGIFTAIPLLGGLITLILNMIIFALAAWIVRGFELKKGFVSAFLGSIALTFLNSVIAHLIS